MKVVGSSPHPEHQFLKVPNGKKERMEMTCPNCGIETNDRNHSCRKDDGSDFLLSAAIGYATDSALLGALVGGDLVGGIMGDLLSGGSLDD